MNFTVRYYRIEWTDAHGMRRLSDPLTTWTDAEIYRRAVGGVILNY